MDQIWVVIGWIVAILMIVVALRLILKKPSSLDLEDGELVIEPQSQQPILPRHLRQAQAQPQVEAKPAPVVEQTPLAQVIPSQQQPQVISSEQPQPQKTQQTTISSQDEITSNSDTVSPLEASEVEADELDAIIEQLQEESIVADTVILSDESSNEPENHVLEAEKIAVDSIDNYDWAHEINVLDAHLSEQCRQDEESALATAEQLVALYVYPSPNRALSGDRALKILLKYGLRFGEMSCFHRYQQSEQMSPLMFSVLRIHEDGTPTGFDLESLPNEEVKGLAFFLALPNAQAVTGFDMMASLAGLIARDIDGMVFDEQSLELTPQLREYWRHFVIEYKPV